MQHSAQTWGEQQMHVYAAMIYEVIDSLGRFPEMGRRRDEVAPGLRSHPAGQHVIFYRLEADELVVRRIIHGRRSLDDVRGL